jgi:hypothetical protein
MSDYTALKFVAGLYIFLGVFALGIGVIAMIVGILISTSTFAAGVTLALTGAGVTAIGQLMRGFIELIMNSREQVRLLKYLAKSQSTKQPF